MRTGPERERELEERLAKLREEVEQALARFEAGEAPKRVFGELRKAVEQTPAGRWDRESVIAKGKEWYAIHGERPAAINWHPASMRLKRREYLLEAWLDGDWPSLGTVLRLFGKWNAFMVACGFEPREGPEKVGPGSPGGPRYDELPEWGGWRSLPFLRERQGLTQLRLAEETNLSPQYLGAIERGKYNNPTVRVILALSMALRVQPAALMEFEERE